MMTNWSTNAAARLRSYSVFCALPSAHAANGITIVKNLFAQQAAAASDDLSEPAKDAEKKPETKQLIVPRQKAGSSAIKPSGVAGLPGPPRQ
jgi:hypothetical protein